MAMRRSKQQSAMEYLMTYGWAILIIAVVLAVLFQLGVFSGGNFTPKAQAGACQVQKTAVGSSLVGECQGQLPEFVGQFNGQNAYISIPDSTTIDSAAFTVSFWVKFSQNFPGGCCYSLVNKGWGVNDQRQWYFIAADTGGGSVRYGTDTTIGANSEYDYQWNDLNWHFVTGTFSGGTMTLYTDAKQRQQASGLGNILMNTQSIYVGTAVGYSSYFPGEIADIQVYNTSLSANEIQALYIEGIGGAPVRPQNLTGWWPLNGDSKDYSGNNNNGNTNNAVFSSSRGSGYTAP